MEGLNYGSANDRNCTGRHLRHLLSVYGIREARDVPQAAQPAGERRVRRISDDAGLISGQIPVSEVQSPVHEAQRLHVHRRSRRDRAAVRWDAGDARYEETAQRPRAEGVQLLCGAFGRQAGKSADRWDRHLGGRWAPEKGIAPHLRHLHPEEVFLHRWDGRTAERGIRTG